MKQNHVNSVKPSYAQRAQVRSHGLIAAVGAAPFPQELNNLAALLRQGQHALAMQAARSMTMRFPKHGFGWKALAAVLLQLNAAEAAIEAARTAAELLPQDADVHCNLGVALARQGRHREAEPSLRFATQINAAFDGAYYNLGNVLIAQGRWIEAEACYRRTIELKPGFADAHFNLGNALFQQGRMGEAEASFRQAIKIKSDFAGAHCNLGNALNVQFRWNEAEACFRRTIQLAPEVPGAHYNLGNSLTEQGRLDEAQACYRRALQLMPDYAEAHNNLGNILKEQGRLAESEACCRRALELKPMLAEAHCSLGNALREQSRLAEALASYRTALDLKPDYTEALVGLGEVAAGNGSFSDAEGFYRRALAIEPQMAIAWAAIPGIRKMTGQDADWLAGAESIVQQVRRPREESVLRYAMGKCCDDIGDFDRAFLNYLRANELVKSVVEKYQPQQQALMVERNCASYHRQFVQSTHVAASASERPLFIVGMPRSGTSLVEQIIASHPAVHGAGELRFWGTMLQKHERKILSAEFDPALLQQLAAGCLTDLASHSDNALRVIDKMPANFSLLGVIHAVFPNARIIHVQRNPIDTCLSNYFQNFNASYSYANDLRDLAHYYRQYHLLMAHWRSVLPDQVFLEVSYESLVEDQSRWSREMIDFIGLDWDRRCLDFHKTDRKVSTCSKWQVRQSIYKTSTARWRNYEKYLGPLAELMKLG